MAVKQVLILRTDLNMRQGQLVGQGTEGGQFSLIQDARKVDLQSESCVALHIPRYFSDIEWIFEHNVAMIVVGVNSEANLLAKFEQARESGIRCTLVKDKGKTQIGEVETYTAVAIGPAEVELLAPITGELQLL